MARFRILVDCERCRRRFDTGIRMDRRNFDRATFAANYHTCPHCGARGTYRKADYRPVEEDPAGGTAGRDASGGA